MATLELPDRWLAPLLRLLATHVPDAETLAYGSRVNGRSHPGSDLDIALRNPAGGPVDPAALHRLTAALEDSDIPIPVEVRDWHRLPEWLREDIANRHVDLRPKACPACPAS